VSVLDGARVAIVRQMRQLEELVKARLEVDMPGIVAGVHARIESRLHLTPLPIAADLALKEAPLKLGRVRTQAWESPECRKIVLSHIAMRPAIEGVALVIHPKPGRQAAIFGADLMALPTRISVNADCYGPPSQTAPLFAELGESFARLGSGKGPLWARGISSGAGLHAKVSLRLVDNAFAALSATIGRYLDVLIAAPVAAPNGAGKEFFSAFHTHGPRRGPLQHILGSAWAERYSRLIFE
jgi:hypothetical protein